MKKLDSWISIVAFASFLGMLLFKDNQIVFVILCAPVGFGLGRYGIIAERK